MLQDRDRVRQMDRLQERLRTTVQEMDREQEQQRQRVGG